MTPHPRTALSTAAVAAAAAVAPATADAMTYIATLTQVVSYGNSGTSAANIASSTATFTYDDVTSLLAQTGGTYNARFTISPNTTLFRTSITGLVIGNGAAASASTFQCTEGNFGGNVGASICGNYSFGANFANESTASWGPGTAVSRTIGGDDLAVGPPQSIANYDGFTTVSFTGPQLVLSNGSCNAVGAGAAVCTVPGALNQGLRLTFQTLPPFAVPLPAAAWLFGGALAVLAGLRRKAA